MKTLQGGYAAQRLGPGYKVPLTLSDLINNLLMERAGQVLLNSFKFHKYVDKKYKKEFKVKHKIGSVVNIRVPERFKHS